MPLPLLAARIFGVPLLCDPRKLDAVLYALRDRLGLSLELAPPAAELGGELTAGLRSGAGMVESPRARAASRVEANPEPIRIAVLQVVGTLANRARGIAAMSGATDYQMLGEEVDRLASDPKVDGILLEVDSFGGEAAGCFDLCDRIHAARQLKPVYAVANQFALSAGYALASQAERLYVPQGGELGSIGVVSTHVSQTAKAEREGVRVTHVHAGATKVDMSSFVDLSPEARGRLQASVDQMYADFLRVVARGGRADEAAARATEARTYIGQAAVDAGLADAVGTRAEALDALRAEVEQRRRAMDLETENANLKAELEELRAEMSTMRAAEAARLEAEDAAYLEHLRATSAAAQNPIKEAELAKVREHLSAGRRDVARQVGDLMLELKCATGSASAPLRPTKPLSPPSANAERAAAAARGKARLLARAGFSAELTPDGTAVVGLSARRAARLAETGRAKPNRGE